MYWRDHFVRSKGSEWNYAVFVTFCYKFDIVGRNGVMASI